MKSCKQEVNQFGRRYFRLENQENILALYYIKSNFLELSYSNSNINDYAFAKYNPSIYHTDKYGNLKLNKGIKVGNDVPKTINMNIPIPTQKYKYRCYSM